MTHFKKVQNQVDEGLEGSVRFIRKKGRMGCFSWKNHDGISPVPVLDGGNQGRRDWAALMHVSGTVPLTLLDGGNQGRRDWAALMHVSGTVPLTLRVELMEGVKLKRIYISRGKWIAVYESTNPL